MTVTATPVCCPADAPCARCRRWLRLWSERQALLAVARSRTCSREDAEDAVSEALLKAAELPDLDEARVGGWLNRVTQFHCADLVRERARHAKRVRYTAGLDDSAADLAEEVCDRGYAAWIAEQADALPVRQRQALQLRADGHDIEAIARQLGIPYKATESLLSRGRRQMREAIAGAMTVLAGLAVCLRRSAAPSTAAVATTAVAAIVLLPAGPTPGAADPAPGTARAVHRVEAPAPAPAPAAAPVPGVADVSAPTAAPGSSVVRPTPAAPAATSGPERRAVVVEDDAVRVAVEHERHDADETAVETLQRCLDDGIVVAPDVVGCAPDGE